MNVSAMDVMSYVWSNAHGAVVAAVTVPSVAFPAATAAVPDGTTDVHEPAAALFRLNSFGVAEDNVIAK